MKFDLEKLQKELFEHREKIIVDFGLRSDLASPEEMMVCLLETIDHSRGRSAGGREIGQREIFKAAVRSFIGGISADVSWGQIVSAEASLRVLLSDYDLPTIAARLERGFLTPKKVEEILPGNRKASRAGSIIDWARRSDTLLRDYSSVLRLKERLQSMVLERLQQPLSDIELTFTIAAAMAAPTRKSTARLASWGIDPRHIKPHGMGFRRAVDFLLNLSWEGVSLNEDIFKIFEGTSSELLESCTLKASPAFSSAESNSDEYLEITALAFLIPEIRSNFVSDFHISELLSVRVRYCGASQLQSFFLP